MISNKFGKIFIKKQVADFMSRTSVVLREISSEVYCMGGGCVRLRIGLIVKILMPLSRSETCRPFNEHKSMSNKSGDTGRRLIHPEKATGVICDCMKTSGEKVPVKEIQS
jgi:hypothetical protein